eukprot:COSAG01_NODE_1335_length_10677_cov_9.862356_2_plen_128_part_00
MVGMSGQGHKWDGMIGLAVGFLWTRTFDNDAMKEMVGDKDGIRILLELMMHFHYEPEIVQNCCGALASVCLNKDNRDMFRQVGGCKIITDLLSENRPRRRSCRARRRSWPPPQSTCICTMRKALQVH